MQFLATIYSIFDVFNTINNMGNQISEYCSYGNRSKKTPSRHSNFYSFTDESVKVVDYTGIIGHSKNLSDLKHKMVNFIPYEIRRIKDTPIDPLHSIVRVTGIKQEGDMFVELSFEIIFTSFGRFNISIEHYQNPYLDNSKCGGVLELYYKFPKDTVIHIQVFKRDFKKFFGWLESIKSNPFYVLAYNNDNMGKIVYAYFRSMGLKDEKEPKLM